MKELLLTYLPLLCAGHLLADFLLQSGAMVERKRTRWPWMAAHGLEVLIVQGLVAAASGLLLRALLGP